MPRDWIGPETWMPRALADCATRPHTLVVLHDVPDACLAHLDDFLAAVEQRGMRDRSDLPIDCTPILDGRVVGDLDGLVAAHGGRDEDAPIVS